MVRQILTAAWPIAVILLCPLILSCQSANPPVPRGHFSASLDETHLSVSMGGRSGSVDLKSQIDAASVYQSQVIFSAHTARGLFFVIDFVGPSPHQSGEDCGQEENLVWVAFDPSLHPINTSSALIGSCSQMIDPGPGILQDARSLSVRYDCAAEHVRRILFFRKEAPELGFTIQTAELAPQQ